jgi:carboxymethylenebutenolidase
MSARGEPVDIGLADGGVLRAELFAPDGAEQWPGVLVLHESFGLNDDIRRLARRFADAGYVALTPDLYSHGRRIVCLSRVMVDLVRGRTAREVADILAAHDALARRAEVDAERIAGTKPGIWAAAVNYGDVPKDRSRLDGVCPVVASYGAKDRVWGHAMAERLEGHLAALGVPHDVKTYDGVGHSFFSQLDGWQGWLARIPTPLAAGYDEGAASDGWQRMLAFFDQHVRSVSGAGPQAKEG